jgi:hypothetical protein
MARANGRIEAGDPLSTAISARAWNRAQDAADLVLGEGTGFAGSPSAMRSAPYAWVYGKNGSGSAVQRWAVVKIGGMAIAPTSSDTNAQTRQFESMPVLSLVSSSSSSEFGSGVAVEPIATDKVGRVAVAGAVQVKASDLGKLDGAAVLWKDANWALVVLGGGSSIRHCVFVGAWPIGGSKSCTVKDSTEELDVKNYFHQIGADCGERDAAVAKIGSEWVLLVAQCG